MKRCGRPRKNFKAATTTQVIQYPESGLPQSAPIISSLVESGQFNLLDLPRLQAELEHLLASATERMVCLSSELNGTALPPSILRHLGLLEAEDSNHPYPTQAPSSLVVTANPNKPLSLIISSQRRQAADAQLQEAGVAANENPVSVPAVPQSSSPSAAERTANPAAALRVCPRDDDLSPARQSSPLAGGQPPANQSNCQSYCDDDDDDVGSASASVKNCVSGNSYFLAGGFYPSAHLLDVLTSSGPQANLRSHDVPNRFWALMEPYCADITETNISYLESILKSYVEEATTAKYFQLPPEANTAVAAATDHNLLPKRLRRDCQKTSQLHGDSEAQEHSELSGALKAATEMVQLARCIDAQLKQPSLSLTTSSEATALEDLVHSIENELYQENVSSVLCSAVTHMAKGDFCPGSPVQANCVQNHLTNDRKSPCLLDAFGPPSPSKLNGGGLPHFPYRVCDSLTSLTTQPLKNLARQLQVSSSFRVEKKVAQAMEELGLFPLTLYLNHLAQRPSSPLLPAHLPPPSTPRWRNAVPPPPPPPSSRGGNSTTADFKREPPTSPPPVNSREPSQCGLAPMDSKSTHPAGEECVTASEHPHHVNGSMAPKSLQTLEKSRSLSTSTTAQPCTRNARRNSHNSSALKGVNFLLLLFFLKFIV
ncbi:unnamed protein product [Schistocephalus solidus]|uniref:HTH OST-type domain-containing protein n=1 Tax=Schistocephalus solidus TaxID=70667 RepID=A0A183TC85_SCHSO|nr:unnamed protein product [Schistocephalus solidus]